MNRRRYGGKSRAEHSRRVSPGDGENIYVWEGVGNITPVGSFEAFLKGGKRDVAVGKKIRNN